MIRLFIALALSATLLATLPRAAAKEVAKIVKVNHFHLMPDALDQTTIDPMIRFERKYLLHGAVDSTDRLARYGSYYTIMWKVADRSQPVTVRFEYRQQKTAGEIKIKEVQISDLKRKNVTKFAMIGDDFAKNGRVVAWRTSLLRGNRVLAKNESFLWD